MNGRKKASLVLFMAALVTAVGILGASAQPPITHTEVDKTTEVFTDRLPCGGELYRIRGQGHVLVHFTAAGIDRQGNFIAPLHFHFSVHAKLVAVPLDGTGPTYTGHFRSSDSENIRRVRGDVLAEVDTDHNKVTLKGSDGSRIRLQEHFHFTVNANGDLTAVFSKMKSSC